MKKRIFALFCALLMLTGLVSIAGAESTASTLPIKVELDFSKYQFTAPEKITVTIRVTNVTDEKFTSPVSVLDPNGSIIEAFGTPAAGRGREPELHDCVERDAGGFERRTAGVPRALSPQG